MYEDMPTYRLRKMIYTMIFDSSDKDYEINDEFNLIIIESLRNIIEYFTSKNLLSDSVKNNVYNYLSRAREFKDNNRTKRIELINDIIGIMNRQEKDNSIIFYRVELFKRRNNNKYLMDYSNEEIKKEIQNVHNSIHNDFLIIISHTSLADYDTFQNEYVPKFKNSNEYYESLNAILYENPTVFKDDLFYCRMLDIIDYNNELYKDNKNVLKTNKKLIHKIKREIKKLNN